jgi:hypothetical protein
MITRQTPLGQATDSFDEPKHTKSAAADVGEYNRSDNAFHSAIGTNVETRYKTKKINYYLTSYF